jgi:hypothetical protein
MKVSLSYPSSMPRLVRHFEIEFRERVMSEAPFKPGMFLLVNVHSVQYSRLSPFFPRKLDVYIACST